MIAYAFDHFFFHLIDYAPTLFGHAKTPVDCLVARALVIAGAGAGKEYNPDA
jgi:hypothetical protein